MKRKFAGILAVALCFTFVAFAMVGCGQQQANSNTSDSQKKATGTTQLKGNITYWALEEPNFVVANKAIVQKFQEKNTGVKITFQSFPYDAYLDKVKASYAANQQSDIQEFFGSWANDYMKNGLLDEVPADMSSEAKDKYFEATMGGYTYNGKLYGIPREFNIENGGVLYYPADLKKVGYNEFPKTYAELLDAAQKLTKKDASGNITHFGFDFLNYDSMTYMFLSFILQQDATYWKADNVHVTFTTPEAEKAMQAMVDLVLKYKVTETKHFSGQDDTYMVFFKGSSSMAMRGPWVIAAGKSEYNLDNFSYGPMPSFTGTSKAFAAESGWGNVVAAKSKNKDLAWEYMRFATSTENNNLWNSKTSTIPSEKKIAQDPAYTTTNPLLKVSLDALQYGKPIGPLQNIDKFKMDIMADQFMKICSGKVDVKTALKNIEDKTNSMIDEIIAQ